MPLSAVPYEPGTDEIWDRLGKEWRAVNGVMKDVHVYATWTTHEDGWTELSGLHIEARSLTSNLLRKIPVARLRRLPATEKPDLAPLRRITGESPDEFATRVAECYRLFAQVTPHPAKAMAQQSHTPVGTVRGWIHEARARGKLPPGTRGRAG